MDFCSPWARRKNRGALVINNTLGKVACVRFYPGRERGDHFHWSRSLAGGHSGRKE